MLNTDCWAPPPESDAAGLARGQRICISNEFPAAALLGQRPHFENHCTRLFRHKEGTCDSETSDACALYSPPQRSLLLQDRPGRDPQPPLAPAHCPPGSVIWAYASAGSLFPMLGTLSYSSPTSSSFPLFSGSVSLPWAEQFQGLGQHRSPEVWCTFQGDSKSCAQSPKGSQWPVGDQLVAPEEALSIPGTLTAAKPASTCPEQPLTSPSFSPATVPPSLQMAGCGPQQKAHKQGPGCKPGVPVLPPRRPQGGPPNPETRKLSGILYKTQAWD